jgi:hypothetical protein
MKIEAKNIINILLEFLPSGSDVIKRFCPIFTTESETNTFICLHSYLSQNCQYGKEPTRPSLLRSRLTALLVKYYTRLTLSSPAYCS